MDVAMHLTAALLLLGFVQDPGLADTLRKGGWKAVDDLGSRPEAKLGLEALAAGKDPELAWWAGAALADLDAREKGGPAWEPPLRVTLSSKERHAGDLLRELMTLAGRKGFEAPEGDRPLTVVFKETPFLEALDEILRQSGLLLARGPGGRMVAAPGDVPPGPRFYHAGFSASVLSLVQRTETTFRDDPSSQLTLQLFLRGDPRCRIQGADAECLLVKAEDDTGRSLLREKAEPAAAPATPSKPSIRFRGPAEAGAVATLSLAIPSAGAKKISILRGTSTLTIARKTVEIVFEDLVKTPSQDRESGGVKAQLRKLERAADEIRLELELTGAEGVRWPDTDAVILEDGEGRPFQRWGSSMNTSGTAATYRMTYRDREGLGAAERLRVSVVTEVYPRTVCFELKDLVLR